MVPGPKAKARVSDSQTTNFVSLKSIKPFFTVSLFITSPVIYQTASFMNEYETVSLPHVHIRGFPSMIMRLSF